jgi:uncharacterized protein (TIGR02452 family)
MNRAVIAAETLQILETGHYQAPSGQTVDLGTDLALCIGGTKFYEPRQLASLREQALAEPGPFTETTFEVANETTLQGGARLAARTGLGRIGVLNFASAKNPGGGFMGGAQAQEESLARSSALYPSLQQCPGFYDYHRRHPTSLYSDRIIYSPRCPVFRTDQGVLLEEPYTVDFITCAAPNAGAIHKNEPEVVDVLEPTLRERGGKILGLAAQRNCETLILGAWGCGVFRNDPALVADVFWQHLKPSGPFWGRFNLVLFSVLDRSAGETIYQAFAERFG